MIYQSKYGNAPVVKWISHRSSEPLFWVRILAGAQIKQPMAVFICVKRSFGEASSRIRKAFELIFDFDSRENEKNHQKVYRICKIRILV